MIKKWELGIIKKRIDNLRKILPQFVVDCRIIKYMNYTNNEVDYLHLAYYSLKDEYLKYNRGVFGRVRMPSYEPKTDGLIGTNMTSSFVTARPYEPLYLDYPFENAYGNYLGNGNYVWATI